MSHPVTFLPVRKTVHVEHGTTLLQAAIQAGLLINTPCGGSGTCGKCRMRICSGHAPSGGSAQHLSQDLLDAGWRLACLTPVTEPLEVDVPPEVRRSQLDQILTDGTPISVRHDPRTLGQLGVAIDLGTTTVAASLFDLYTGLERATIATLNRQIHLGDDVISRIHAVQLNPDNLRCLQSDAIATLNELLASLCSTCGEHPHTIQRLTIAGNTAMQHLLLGLDPTPLGQAPFTPAFTDAQTIGAKRLGLNVSPEATLIVFPQIGGFVGGDTLAGLLAAHFDSCDRPTLLVDIGTNGEIALLSQGQLWVASTAAGPAFEGSRISQGMRATNGAIDHVWMQNGELRYHVIGDGLPQGLCGSGLVDVVAELLRIGLIDETGLLSSSAPEAQTSLSHRVCSKNDNTKFILATASDDTALVSITQQDIRELQLAAGAIRTGIEILLSHAHLLARDLDSLLLAGGFGNYMRRENALRIGLLPSIHYLSIRFIGNASLTGAKRVLLSQAELLKVQALNKRAQHVDLSSDPAFRDRFIENMLFPAN